MSTPTPPQHPSAYESEFVEPPPRVGHWVALVVVVGGLMMLLGAASLDGPSSWFAVTFFSAGKVVAGAALTFYLIVKAIVVGLRIVDAERRAGRR